MKLNQHGLQQLMREIRKTIVDDIAEALQRLGFVAGSKLDGSNIIGVIPTGSARIIVQKDGVQVGEPTYILNFVGSGFVVTWDSINFRVNIQDPTAVPPFEVIDYSFNTVTNVAGDTVIVG